jgi:oligopeptide transport system permease protein
MSDSFDRPADQTDLLLREVDSALPGPMVDAGVSAPRAAGGGLAELAPEEDIFVRKQTTIWGDAWRRMRRNKLAMIGLFIVLAFLVLAIFAPLIAPYGEAEVVDVRLVRLHPSWAWPMGLDTNGRDIFSRLMFGARVSMLVGVVSYLIVLAIAIPVGSIAGYYGGWIDTTLMRIVDIVFTIPQILLVLMFVNWRGPGIGNILLAIGLVGWVTEARLIRAQFLSLREQDYIKASRVAGAGGPYIILRHLLPNSLTPLIVAASFGIPTAIFTEAAISFIGVGVRPPQASWGQMVALASNPSDVQADPHMLLFPVIAIGLTMLGFTFLGDGLRDALDPKGNA